MRKLLYILIAVLLMPCCMHQPKYGVRSLLKEAERMMRTCPDTAYFLLQEMHATMDLGTEADSAYHGLLLMEAQAKNGVKLTDTTRLQSLIHYYQEREDSLMNVRLLRLRGLAHRDGSRYEEAVKCYNAAIGEAKRMVADYRHKDCSGLKMEEKDWTLLRLAMDKKENGAVTRIRHEYQLSEMEVRLLCLHLAGVATAHISLFLGISRNTLYGKNNEMFSKMGIKRTSSTFKNDIQDFLKNRK